MANTKKNNESILEQYVGEMEGGLQSEVIPEEIKEPVKPSASIKDNIIRGERYDEMPKSWEGGITYKDNIGYANIPIESLPTGGLFYPNDTRILIRAARGAEIKHWSTMNDRDLEEISNTDDILNYVVERCITVRNENVPQMNWKDLKDVDRLYLLMAVSEFTFLEDDNHLIVPLSEGKEMKLTKDMIDFIQIPQELMKFYSPDEKCFVLNLPSRTIKMHIPSLGTSNWIKNYVRGKNLAREGYDEDFILFAPMLIGDFRKLSQRAYEEMVSDSAGWTVTEWSVIAKVRDLLASASEPKIKYKDESGQEVTIPLTFRGGLKALFTIQDPLSILG